jgi:putative thiamine transport system substrate-binding protein
MDFTIPTEGYEAPWGLARLTFFHDAARDPVPPRSPDDLESFARQNPGRFTYPQPPDFLGSTFLKQLLISFAPDRGRLQREADDQSFAEQTGAVWSYLERLHPHLWRQGRTFPANVASLRRLFADNEIRVAFTFNPADVTAAIARGELAPSTQAYGFVGGTLGNTHFVAIPRNASAKAGALVLANFLLSPEAQARKADPNVWGDPTVLSPDLLTAQEQALFAPETLKPVFSEAVLAEPHPSWTERLDAEWKRRFGGGR